MSSSLGMIGEYESSVEEEIEEEPDNSTQTLKLDKNFESKTSIHVPSSSAIQESMESTSSFDDLFNSFYADGSSMTASKEIKASHDRTTSSESVIIGSKRKFDERSSYPMKSTSKLSFKPPQLSKPNINTEDTKAWVSTKS